MAKKSFKKSARDSVASAFFSEATEATSDSIDTKDSVSTRDPLELPPYRINLRLKGELKEYLDEVAWENRTSITQYLNNLIEADQDKWEEKQKVKQ